MRTFLFGGRILDGQIGDFVLRRFIENGDIELAQREIVGRLGRQVSEVEGIFLGGKLLYLGEKWQPQVKTRTDFVEIDIAECFSDTHIARIDGVGGAKDQHHQRGERQPRQAPQCPGECRGRTLSHAIENAVGHNYRPSRQRRQVTGMNGLVLNSINQISAVAVGLAHLRLDGPMIADGVPHLYGVERLGQADTVADIEPG